MKPLFFLDTDLGPDCDDAAALAILLQLCREGKAHLLGVTHCTGSPFGAGAVDAIQKRMGFSLPIGCCEDGEFLSGPDYLSYIPFLYREFVHDYPAEKKRPAAMEVFCRALEKVPEKSVTLITIGPLNHLSLFLSHPASAPLMREKVRRIVSMGGAFEMEKPHAEWNILMDIPAARHVLSAWEGEMDFCPFEAFSAVLTGECLKSVPDHPVARAYALYTKGNMLRPSWDPGTVAAAVLGAESLYAWSEKGHVQIDEQGFSTFLPDPCGRRRYLRLTGSAEEAAALLENMLARAVSQ